MKPEIFCCLSASLGELVANVCFARRACSERSLGERVANVTFARRACSEQASLGHFLDWAIRELGLRSFEISVIKMSRSALKNVLKY